MPTHKPKFTASLASQRRISQLRVESLENRQLLAADLVCADPSTAHFGRDENELSVMVGTAAATKDSISPFYGGGILEAEGEPADDLVALANALFDSGTILYGAAWDSQTTSQRELFEDGGMYLPFVEVTNPDRSLNQVGIDEGIDTFPTWEFPDGTRLTGPQSLTTLAAQIGVIIPQSETPSFYPIHDLEVKLGTPVHIPVDAYDPDGEALSVNVTSSDASVFEVTEIAGNQSFRLDIAGYGDLVFELFEQRAPRPSGRVIELTQNGFYDGISFHRIIDDFVIQGGDPLGNGTGGSSLGDFDDQFHLDLQHARDGVLSYAKSSDDTNDSQFFITEAAFPHLDFNHSVFGQLIEGEPIREAISETAVGAQGVPINNITIEQASIFTDLENHTLMLRAVGSPGQTANITVEVVDVSGNTFSQTFVATVTADDTNGAPFLNDVRPVRAQVDTPITIQLSAQDGENDELLYDAIPLGDTIFGVDVNGSTGEVTVTPPTGFRGELQILTGVTQTTGTTTSDSVDRQRVSILVGDYDLVALAQAIRDSGTTLFGAAWCPFCTEQRELFEDGGKYLPFVEVTNPDRTPNQIAIDENITEYPTWEFPDGSRLVGLQSLTTIAERAGITIPLGSTPSFHTLSDTDVAIGSPLHIPVDAYDPNGDPLTISVSSSDPDLLTATMLEGNRSLNLSTAGFGDMIFQLFEQRAPRASGRVIELAEDGFYDGILFHRVIDEFVIQAGDPTGTGAGGSSLGDFDDDYHLDLQHNAPGILSFAKAGDDTNDSQFFVAELPFRHLDFNYSVFGTLVEGEFVREGISNTATAGQDRPTNDVVIDMASVFEDTENGVLMLKPTGMGEGTATITVTVTDSDGNSTMQSFAANVVADTANGAPFLNPIPAVRIPKDGSGSLTLTSQDKEGDPVTYSVAPVGTTSFDVSVDSSTGEVTFTAPGNFEGDLQFLATVEQIPPTTTSFPQDNQLVTIHVGSTHQNLNPFDVNDDGVVAPIDALLVINFLNTSDTTDIADLAPPPPFLDVNGDLTISPLDALLVINALNSQGLGEGEFMRHVNPQENEDHIDGWFGWLDDQAHTLDAGFDGLPTAWWLELIRRRQFRLR